MFEKYFQLKANGTTMKTEIIAGITTFLTMAYILAVNPIILSAAGMDKGALFTATAVASIVGTMTMALLAKLPFAQAPGMGINAFFAFTVCGTMGYSWQFALTAILIEGVAFLIMNFFNVREIIVNAIPDTLKNAISAGIGLFIAFVGLQGSKIVVTDQTTFLTIGHITEGQALMAMIGLIITSVLLIKKVKGALLLGILATTIIGIPMGLTSFEGIFSLPPNPSPLFFKFDFSQVFSWDMVIVVFTFLFVDVFDTVGTLIGVCKKANMLDENGQIPNVKKAFYADTIGTLSGAVFGTSTVTTYVESAAGVSEGGRTGMTALITAGCFAIALLFAPLFLSIPAAATAPVLILVGLMMLSQVKEIDFEDYAESIPAFICIIAMPMMYSITEGIALGLILYVFLNVLSGKFKKVSVSMYVLALLFLLKYIFIK
ncbi:MAG: NCS2 family permease [Bacteroidales bacterium]|nr:NCS2 family permease [Bacteroidales bacterium]